MSLCNLTIQYLESRHLDRLTANCPVAGCGLPVARHRDENAPAVLPIIGAPGGGAELKQLVKEVIIEIESEKEKNTFVFSTASKSEVRGLLSKLRINTVVATMDIIPNVEDHPDFVAFQWNDLQSEAAQLPHALQHLTEELTKFNAELMQQFELHDVHTDKRYLSLEDEKLGKLSGGVDCIISPRGLVTSSALHEACVAIELKTSSNVARQNQTSGDEETPQGFSAFDAQAKLELLAASYHSDQLVFTFVTDLVNGAKAWRLSRDSEDIVIEEFSSLTLKQMAVLITHHLSSNCFPEKNFKLKRALGDSDLNQKDSILTQSMFKKARVSDVDLALEHFYELLEETSQGTRERAQVVREFLWSQGLPDSSFLNMYC